MGNAYIKQCSTVQEFSYFGTPYSISMEYQEVTSPSPLGNFSLYFKCKEVYQYVENDLLQLPLCYSGHDLVLGENHVMLLLLQSHSSW